MHIENRKTKVIREPFSNTSLHHKSSHSFEITKEIIAKQIQPNSSYNKKLELSLKNK